MNTAWREFLKRQNASFSGDDRLQFGEPLAAAAAVQQRDTLSSCLHWGVLRIQGPDAMKFLGGQVTSDVRELSAEHSQPTAWCNPKGRVLVSGRLLLQDDACAFIIRRDLLSVVEKRLRMYVLRAKVTVEDAADQWVLLGCAGPNSADLLAQHFAAPIPQAVNQASVSDGCAIVRLPGPLPRYLICCPQDHAPVLWTALTRSALPVGSDAWDLTEILAGTVMIGKTGSEAYLPQMLQLERYDGLSFSKGCYPGQEIVTRLQFRGELKQRIYYAELQGDELPTLPAPVLLTNGEEQQKIGEVLESAPLARDKLAVLAVMNIADAAVLSADPAGMQGVHVGQAVLTMLR